SLFQYIKKIKRGPFRRQRSIHQQAFLLLEPEYLSGSSLLEKGPQRAELGPLNGDPRGHCMPAALNYEPGFSGLAYQSAKVESGHRPAGTRADTVLVEGSGKGGPTSIVLQARRYQTNHDRMPLGARRKHDAWPVAAGQFRIHLGAGLCQHLLLHRLTLLVQPIEHFGNGPRLHGIVGCQQAAAECRIPDATAGIDARADHEGEMESV